jgi:hypothetical protein
MPLRLKSNVKAYEKIGDLVKTHDKTIKRILAGKFARVETEKIISLGSELRQLLIDADAFACTPENAGQAKYSAAAALRKTFYETNHRHLDVFSNFCSSLEVFGHWRKVETGLKNFKKTGKAEPPVHGEKEGRIAFEDPDTAIYRTGSIRKDIYSVGPRLGKTGRQTKTALQSALDLAAERKAEHEANLDNFFQHFFSKVLKR